ENDNLERNIPRGGETGSPVCGYNSATAFFLLLISRHRHRRQSNTTGIKMIALASSSSLLYTPPAGAAHGSSSSSIIIYSSAAPPARPFFLPSPLHLSNSFLPKATPIQNSAADLLLHPQIPSLAAVPENWIEFADRVSGEWDGFGADFTPQGTPIELPESVVPEAYREWEVLVHDWQTQCPTLARPDPTSLLSYSTVKLLPTVGCEADAATRYSSENKLVSSASAFAYHSSGSYVAVWPAAELELELEHCLVNPQDRESRVRILLSLRSNNGTMSVVGIRAFREQWYGPFRNGEQLGGCAIRDSAFAATPPLHPSKLLGVPWRRGSVAVAAFRGSTGSIQQLDDGSSSLESECLVRDESGMVMLPKEMWCSVKDRCCEVGWMFDDGKAVTFTSIFAPDAKLQEVQITQETADLKG
ncbi:hypothetical protein LINGRAHAP2_LOCUS35630, partial [Linum grandiflorum]